MDNDLGQQRLLASYSGQALCLPYTWLVLGPPSTDKHDSFLSVLPLPTWPAYLNALVLVLSPLGYLIPIFHFSSFLPFFFFPLSKPWIIFFVSLFKKKNPILFLPLKKFFFFFLVPLAKIL